MRAKHWLLLLISFFLLSMGGCVACLSILSKTETGDHWAEKEGDLAILEIKGPIVDSTATNQKLVKLRKNKSLKAVVLRIDSPGGGVGASEEIYTEVKKLVSQKIVVVSMGSVAASGGYYIAVPATEIIANHGTATGSIGVLMEHIEVDELLKWGRVSAEILKAGHEKDVGSPFRKMTSDERRYMQELLDNMHAQFQRAVSEGRKIPLEEVKKIATGRVFTGEQAKELKLIDGFGNLEDAIERARVLAGITGEPKIIREEKSKGPLMDAFLGEGSSERVLQGILSWRPSSRILFQTPIQGN